MSAENYAQCEARVLTSEGGYTNDPRDPGGATNWGITIADARMYWKPAATAEDVRAMPKSVAQDIYRKKYWDALRCDDLPAGLDYTMFDYGVNSGISRAGKVLRRVLGLPDTTYRVDASVIAALSGRDVAAVIAAVNAERLRFLQSLRTWPTFGRGWGARVESVNLISRHMAASVSVPTSKPVTPTVTKPVTKPAVKPATKPAPTLSGPAVVVVAGSGAAAAAHQAGLGAGTIIFLALLVAAAVSAVFLIGRKK